MQLCSASKLLLVLGVVRQTLALSSYSPRDLESFPSYAVVVNERGVLNETVDELLSETLEVRAAPCIGLGVALVAHGPPHIAGSAALVPAQTPSPAHAQRSGLRMHRSRRHR